MADTAIFIILLAAGLAWAQEMYRRVRLLRLCDFLEIRLDDLRGRNGKHIRTFFEEKIREREFWIYRDVLHFMRQWLNHACMQDEERRALLQHAAEHPEARVLCVEMSHRLVKTRLHNPLADFPMCYDVEIGWQAPKKLAEDIRALERARKFIAPISVKQRA